MRVTWGTLAALVLVSRIATALDYVGDPDSLRFALSTVRYSVVDLQPHFPGYPLYCLILRGATAVLGQFGTAFALLGGVSTVALIGACLSIAALPLRSFAGALLAVLVALNPMIWLMGTRYMPDLAGATIGLWALALLARDRRPGIAGVLVACLPGVRLSVLPLVLVPFVHRLVRGRSGWALATATGVAGLAWLLPWVALVGPTALWAAGTAQTGGHFQTFGGTVITEPGLWARLVAMGRAIWADGLGAYVPGRSWITISVALPLVVLVVAALRRPPWSPRVGWLVVGATVYVVWIAGFQNVLYKSRHVLPLVPLMLVLLVHGFQVLRSRWPRAALVVAAILVVGSGTVTAVLVAQQQRPTAIAQTLELVREMGGHVDDRTLVVVSVPLVREFLERQGIEAEFIDPGDVTDRARLESVALDTPAVVIGRIDVPWAREPSDRRRFFHNPYVNPMWARVDVAVYE